MELFFKKNLKDPILFSVVPLLSQEKNFLSSLLCIFQVLSTSRPASLETYFLFLSSLLCTFQAISSLCRQKLIFSSFFSSLLCTFSSFVLFTSLETNFCFPKSFLGFGQSGRIRLIISDTHPAPALHQCHVETDSPANMESPRNIDSFTCVSQSSTLGPWVVDLEASDHIYGNKSLLSILCNSNLYSLCPWLSF